MHKMPEMKLFLVIQTLPSCWKNMEIVLSEDKNLQEAASKLYDALHQLDKEDLDIIIAERLPDYGLGKSINDRLERATK